MHQLTHTIYTHTRDMGKKSNKTHLLHICRIRSLDRRIELLPAMTIHHADVAQPRSGPADLLGAVGAAVAGGAGHEEAVDEVADGFLASDAGEGGEDDGDVEFDAAEDVGFDDGAGDVGGVGLEDEEDAGEADDCDAGSDPPGQYMVTVCSKIVVGRSVDIGSRTYIAPMNS